MSNEWHALRPKADGELRGYSKNDVWEPRRRMNLPLLVWELGQCGLDCTGLAGDLCTLFSVKELMREMRMNMTHEAIRKKRKVMLIKEWIDNGDPFQCELYGIRMEQGGRRPI